MEADRLPQNWLSAGGFVKLAAIAHLAAQGGTPYCPVPEPQDETRARYALLPTDAPAVAQWRQRLGTTDGQALYKQRSLVEWPNAQARSRYGVQQVRVRGQRKVRCIALWVALTHNLLIWLRHQRPAAPAASDQPARPAA